MIGRVFGVAKQHPWHVSAGGIGLVGAMAVWWTTAPHGIGLAHDPIGYVSVAQSVADGDGFVRYDDSPLFLQPLLYPAVLALASLLLNVDAVEAARWVAALGFGGLVGLTGWIVATLGGRWAAAGASGSVLFAVPFAALAGTAYTEVLFSLLVLGALAAISRYVELKTPRWLLAASSLTAAACVTRYAGVTVAVTVGLSILLTSQLVRHRIRDAAIFSAVVTLVLGANLWRNALVKGQLTGERLPSAFKPWEVVEAYATIAVRWVRLPLIDADAVVLIALAWIGLVAALVVISIRSRQPSTSRRLLPYILFASAYAAFITWASASVMFDRPSDRFLAPLYAPLVVCLFGIGVASVKRFGHPAIQLGLGSLHIAALASMMSHTVPVCLQQRSDGHLFDGPSWQKSPVITSACSTLTERQTVLSNAPEALYAVCAFRAKRSPAKHLAASVPTSALPALLSGASLVWLDHLQRYYLYSPGDLTNALGASSVTELPDGALYTFPLTVAPPALP